MKENLDKNTTIKEIVERYLKQENMTIYKLSKESKLSAKTIKKMLENTSSNFNKKTLEKLHSLKKLNLSDKKFIRSLLTKKNVVQNKIINNQKIDILLISMLEENKELKEKIKTLEDSNNLLSNKNREANEIKNADSNIILKKEELKDLEEKIDRLNLEYKEKQFLYEKLERTSGVRSKITWACIDIQKYLSEKIIEIGNIFNMADQKSQVSSLMALKQLSIHLKRMTATIDDIVENTSDIIEINNQTVEEKEKKMSNIYEEYGIKIPKKPFNIFREDDKVKILTFSVGKIIPRVLRELDQKKEFFTARSTSLLIKGNKEKRENHKMKQYVKLYDDFYENMSDNIANSLGDILEEIIEDMTRYDKSQARKDKFFRMLDDPIGLKLLFIVGMIAIGEHLIETKGYIKNGRYLELVLKARKELSGTIKNIFKKMNRNEYTEDEAKILFRNLIENKVQDFVQFDVEIYEEVKREEDLTNLCEETSVDEFIIKLVDNAREKATGRPRLLDLI